LITACFSAVFFPKPETLPPNVTNRSFNYRIITPGASLSLWLKQIRTTRSGFITARLIADPRPFATPTPPAQQSDGVLGTACTHLE